MLPFQGVEEGRVERLPKALPWASYKLSFQDAIAKTRIKHLCKMKSVEYTTPIKIFVVISLSNT